MKIIYSDEESKNIMNNWINSCLNPYIISKKNDSIISNLLLNKNKILQRIIIETNCFNEDVTIKLSLSNKKIPNIKILDFITSEEERGLIELNNIPNTKPIISIIQDNRKTDFIYTCKDNPLKYNDNLLQEINEYENVVTKK